MSTDTRLDETTEKVVAALRACSDEELSEVHQAITKALVECLDEGKDTRPARAIGYLKDFVVHETNLRWAAIWHAEAEMQGGHRVAVTKHLNQRDTYNAICQPSISGDDPFCWEGPNRATRAEAEADGRRHNPLTESVVDWWDFED